MKRVYVVEVEEPMPVAEAADMRTRIMECVEGRGGKAFAAVGVRITTLDVPVCYRDKLNMRRGKV